jgi:hypothetical protein
MGSPENLYTKRHSDGEKFWDYAKEFSLLQNVDGKYFTFEEYTKP